MKLEARDMSLVLAGLKSISNDETFTSDQQRRAKELEDKVGARFSKGCSLSGNPLDLAECGEDVVVHATQSMSDFDAKL
ncbi:MAG: hypothetical protein JJV99_06275 [Colwellia sp.]|nr:hypothetical protein [Colwellia sp.]